MSYLTVVTLALNLSTLEIVQEWESQHTFWVGLHVHFYIMIVGHALTNTSAL